MIRGQRVLITGGAGMIGSTIAEHLVDLEPAEIVVCDNLVRGRLANLDSAMARGPIRMIEGDLRDRDLVRKIMDGIDVCFHQAAIRITQCAQGAAPRARGPCRRHVQCARGRGRSGRRQGGGRLFGLGVRARRGVPHLRTPSPLRQPHAVRGGEGVQRGPAPQLPRHARARLRGPLRYFNVYGPRMDIHGVSTEVLVRWMERIAAGSPPLILGDGSQTMDFVYVDDVARANVLAAGSTASDRVYNVASGVETSLEGLARALLRVMGSELEPEYGPERTVNAVSRRLADTGGARDALGFEAEVSLDEGLARLVDWWQAEQTAGRQQAAS